MKKLYTLIAILFGMVLLAACATPTPETRESSPKR